MMGRTREILEKDETWEKPWEKPGTPWETMGNLMGIPRKKHGTHEQISNI